jgi:hypothetical protein
VIDPELLADRLEDCSRAVRANGGLTWERCEDWNHPGRLPTRGERGGGLRDGVTDEALDDRREDAAASRYKAELAEITRRLDADTARLKTIIRICNPSPPKTLASKDLLVAQVAADGWCVSCYRREQFLEPITMQTARNGAMVPIYRDLCRPCGKWKSENGELPSMEVLQTWHRGGRVRVKA